VPANERFSAPAPARRSWRAAANCRLFLAMLGGSGPLPFLGSARSLYGFLCYPLPGGVRFSSGKRTASQRGASARRRLARDRRFERFDDRRAIPSIECLERSQGARLEAKLARPYGPGSVVSAPGALVRAELFGRGHLTIGWFAVAASATSSSGSGLTSSAKSVRSCATSPAAAAAMTSGVISTARPTGLFPGG
jgi:hypothetical protein